MPSSSAARITSIPLGTVISKPSMVTVTPSVTGASAPPSLATVISWPPSRALRLVVPEARKWHRGRLVLGAGLGGPAPAASRPGSELKALGSFLAASVGPERGGCRIERAAASLGMLDELVTEVFDGRHDRADRAVAERAEGAAQDVVADVEQLVQVLVGPLAVL